MNKLSCDVLIVGGGLGGVAAALAAARTGLNVILTEETHWVGGQLTSQAVPPDEHPWIESFGSTGTYRHLRTTVREIYQEQGNLRADLPDNFNPGGGWVSKICARPDVWHAAIMRLLTPYLESDRLSILPHTVASGGSHLSSPPTGHPTISPTVCDQTIRSITLLDLRTNQLTTVDAAFYIDATELGDLLALTGTEWVTGAESRCSTGESAAGEIYNPDNQQALTWVFAVEQTPSTSRSLEKPDGYEIWRTYQPPFWPNPLLNLQDLDPISNKPRRPPLPLFADDWRCWFKYRQIIDPSIYAPGRELPTTIVNWPQNDYFLREIINTSPQDRWERLQAAKGLSRCLLYYLQTECPRPDGEIGYPNLRMAQGSMGTDDGFALTPYIRESRRIVACQTITQPMVTAEGFRPLSDTVGLGSYRIDLHPSTGGDAYIDLATVPFELPLGSLIPVRTKNLIPACKNIGTTHITNGCYRLHPVEWNIGEVAGYLAAFCKSRSNTLQEVQASTTLTQEFQGMIQDLGVEIHWPQDLSLA